MIITNNTNHSMKRIISPKRPFLKLMAYAFTCALFTSCSPFVTTSVLQSYPAIPIDSVEVFDFGSPLPPHEIIGNVSVIDRGTATKCINDYKLVNIAKKKTANVGGNGLQIVTHMTPQIDKTNHQIKANMLYITDHRIDSTILNTPDETIGAQVFYNKPGKQKYNVIKITGAFSRITSKVMYNNHEISTKNGNDFFLESEHIGSRGFGFGINLKYNITNYGDIGDGELVYFGPSLVYCYYSSFKFRWVCSMGMGYVGYTEKKNGGPWESGFGVLTKFGFDYIIDKRFGVGIEANNIFHSFQAPEGFPLKKNEKYGYNTISIGMGLRFFF